MLHPEVEELFDVEEGYSPSLLQGHNERGKDNKSDAESLRCSYFTVTVTVVES